MRFKKSLKKPDEILDYIYTTLINIYGFEESDFEISYSGLSDSSYLEIYNWYEKTNELSNYNDESLKIRISNHDLPPSYDGLHGYFDFDLKSSGSNRYGNTGEAIDYYYFLDYVDSLVPHVKRDKINLQEWMTKYDEIYDWYKQNTKPYYFPYWELRHLSKTDRLKKFKKLMDIYGSDIDILKDTILEIGESDKDYIYWYNKMIKDLF